jgi:hypothetical protein
MDSSQSSWSNVSEKWQEEQQMPLGYSPHPIAVEATHVEAAQLEEGVLKLLNANNQHRLIKFVKNIQHCARQVKA